MIGSTKLPKAPGIAGMMTKKVMIAPCKVKKRLYVSASMIVSPGAINSVRMPRAKRPPSKKLASVAITYITPIRLWSSVMSHDMIPLEHVM